MTESLTSKIVSNWAPPSASLILRDGIWCTSTISAVSYPQGGNAECLQVEDGSFWFEHRIRCIRGLIANFPPGGTLWDIGGGNGFVAAKLQATGLETALLEPGDGVYNARSRGLRNVVQATLTDARFSPHSLPAVGTFDVLEHIENESKFLAEVHDSLIPGGRFYCTVPALPFLWSAEDTHAGHFRRYSASSLRTALEKAEFEVEFVTYFFASLVVPLALSRTVPYRLGLVDASKLGSRRAIQADHQLPRTAARFVERFHGWEQRRIASQRPIRWGTSLLCVARARKNHGSSIR